MRRALRKKEDQTYEVLKHELEIEIEPKEHSLKTRDRITIRAKKDGVESVSFTTSLVSCDTVESPTEIT